LDKQNHWTDKTVMAPTSIDPTPTPDAKPQTDSGYVPPTPLRCLTGASIAGAIAFAMYRLTLAIANTFAAKPLSLTNPLAARIGALVRSIVVGISTMGTMVFGVVTLGLTALAIQLIIQRFTKSQDDIAQEK
jgi:hypothetical protein